MTQASISLPDDLRAFVREQVEGCGYDTAGEYIHDLIRQAQNRSEHQRLEALLIEGLDSGPGIEVTPEFWVELRAELLARHGGQDARFADGSSPDQALATLVD